MPPSKTVMKAALRVLTALSEHQEPDQADIDELHWYAPAEQERSIDELACDAIQRAIKDREEVRKAIKVTLRERALALNAAERDGGSDRIAVVSPANPEFDITRLIWEHAERRREYIALTAKVRRIGVALEKAASQIIKADPEIFAAASEAKSIVDNVGREVDINGLAQLLSDYARLGRRLIADQQILQQHGLE